MSESLAAKIRSRRERSETCENLDREWGSYLNYTVTVQNQTTAGVVSPELFDTDGLLLTFTPGVVGTAEIVVTATDESNANPISLTVQVTVTATPPVIEIEQVQHAREANTSTSVAARSGIVRLRRDGNLAQPLTVAYTVDAASTATANVDYTALTGNVTFAANSATAEIAIVPLDDNTGEPSETIRVSLTPSATGVYTLLPAPEATVYLDDTEAYAGDAYGGAIVETIRVTSFESASEAGQVKGRIHFERTAVDLYYQRYFTFEIRTGLHAATTSDFYSGTLHFASYETEAVLEFTPYDDSLPEGTETIYAHFADQSVYILLPGMMGGVADFVTEDVELPLYDNDSPSAAALVDLVINDMVDEIEESPGAFLGVNDDFDEANVYEQSLSVGEIDLAFGPAAVADNEPNRNIKHRIEPTDTDLLHGTLTVASTTGEPISGTLAWTIPTGIKVWWQRHGRWVEVTDRSYTTGHVEQLRVEGIAPGGGLITAEFTPANGSAAVDSACASIISFWVDLNIDSNNDGAIDESDEAVEDIAGVDATPGKIVLTSNDDVDRDGWLGWQDGFDWTDQIADDNTSAGALTPLRITLSDAIDLDDVLLEIEYDASNPAAIVGSLDVRPGGSLRIWKRNAAEPRNMASALVSSNGDFVAPGTYSAAQLGLTSHALTLFLEGINPSFSTGDLPIRVTAHLIGGPGIRATLSDQVRVTATRIELWAHNDVGFDSFETSWLIPMGLPHLDSSTGEEYGASPTQSYTVRVYDPRSTITQFTLEGTSLPLVREGDHFTSCEFVALTFEGASILAADVPVETVLESRPEFRYAGFFLPDDTEVSPKNLMSVTRSEPAPNVVADEDTGILTVDSLGADTSYAATVADDNLWDMTGDTQVDITFRLLAQGATGTDGAFQVVIGDGVSQWIVGVQANRLVTFPGNVRTETMLEASLLDNAFHTLKLEKLANDPQAHVVIDGVPIVTELGAPGGIAGFTWGDTGATTAGYVEFQNIDWKYDELYEEVLDSIRPSDIKANRPVVIVSSSQPAIQYNPTKKVDTVFAPNSALAADNVVAKYIKEIVDEMIEKNWTRTGGGYLPTDDGAFGKEVHKRLETKLGGVKATQTGGWGWNTNPFKGGVLIKKDTLEILEIGATQGTEKALCVDVMWFKPGYSPGVGDVLDLTKARPYEIKTSLNGVISSAQRQAYNEMFGARKARLVISPHRMNAAGQIVANVDAEKILKVLSIAGLVATAYHVAAFEAQGAEYQGLVDNINQAKANPDALNRGAVIKSFNQYMEAATGGAFTTNIANAYVYKKLLDELADP